MNFSLTEMTFLRYFIPLTIVGNKNNIKSTYYIKSNQKYNSPYSNLKHLDLLSEKYEFEVKDINQDKESDITFLVEGCGSNYFQNNKVSFTYMTDFQCEYNNYINDVDHVVFPSKYIAEYYKCNSSKNLYFGIPKYDFIDSEEDIRKKHNLYEKYVLVIFPKQRDISKIDLGKLYRYMRQLGYKVIVKTRGKDNIPDGSLKGDYTFVDGNWYPHDTLDLIKISDFVLNFGSTVIKECVMLKKKVVNINLKPYTVGFPFLYSDDIILNLKPDVSELDFKTRLLEYLNKDMYNLFVDYKKKYLFDNNNKISENILRHFGVIR